MQTIANWINSDQDFATGLELYREHLGETVLFQVFKQSGASKFNREKLLFALQQLLSKEHAKPYAKITPFVSPANAEEVAELERKWRNYALGDQGAEEETIADLAETINDLQEEVDQLSNTVYDLEDLVPTVSKLEEKLDQVLSEKQLEKLKAKHSAEAIELMNERSELFRQLSQPQTHPERYQKAQRILDIRKELDAIYNPAAPAPAPEPITDPVAQLKRINNLRSSISKHKNNPKKIKEVAAWRLEKEELEASL